MTEQPTFEFDATIYEIGTTSNPAKQRNAYRGEDWHSGYFVSARDEFALGDVVHVSITAKQEAQDGDANPS